MSKEYIEREVAIQLLEKVKNDFSPTVRPMFDVFKHILSEAPAADVEPVRHGEWIFTGKETLFSREVKCNQCETKQLGETPYCPNCGAKMDGGNK